MATFIWLLIFITCFAFSYVLMFGAPYLPTTIKQRESALELLNLPKGSLFLDLGCGDGGMLRCAAKKGLVVVGYELNPLLFIIAWLTTRKYKDQVTIKWANFWHAPINRADGIYVFLLDKYMAKLDDLLEKQCIKKVKLASFAFEVPGKKPITKKNGIFLYQYDIN